jgi:Glycosyltransferase sugar-binding region containing DXD motif
MIVTIQSIYPRFAGAIVAINVMVSISAKTIGHEWTEDITRRHTDKVSADESNRRHILAQSTSSAFGSHSRKPALPQSLPDISIMNTNPFVINPMRNESRGGERGGGNRFHDIPRYIWIAVKDRSDSLPNHLYTTFQRNPNWRIYVCDNACKDHFMTIVFADTSTLWAYNLINPLVGAAKADIWRYSVLYLFGGLYLDDDR